LVNINEISSTLNISLQTVNNNKLKNLYYLVFNDAMEFVYKIETKDEYDEELLNNINDELYDIIEVYNVYENQLHPVLKKNSYKFLKYVPSELLDY
jgi:hypothetical protein